MVDFVSVRISESYRILNFRVFVLDNFIFENEAVDNVTYSTNCSSFKSDIFMSGSHLDHVVMLTTTILRTGGGTRCQQDLL